LIHARNFLGRIDFIFLCLILGVIGVNFPYLNPTFFPHHDTLYNFQVFYFFYNEFFFHHTIAQWMPYGAYGIPAALYQIAQITPGEYFTILIGGLLQVKNVLLLFKLAILLEQFTFLLGLYLLAKVLFKKRTTIVLVCIASFCSMEWYYQLFFNFRIIEFFPFTLYFLVLFFERKRSFYFWMSGLSGILWTLGSGFYFSFLYFFLGSIFCAVLFAYHPGAWKFIWPRHKIDAVVLALFFFHGFILFNFF